ncbi:KLHL2 protein, partial [Polypterus senegalus]|nr:KLHL2 protein [Polypterus senegalus]
FLLICRCTKLCHHKPHDLKDDVSEKQCPVTVNPRHMKKAFRVMNELRSQKLLCDVTIVAEDVEIAAHRVVLAACSPYFHAMFTGEMSESKAKRVRIKEMDGWTLGILIDYVYTAEIQVTEENVQVCVLYRPLSSMLVCFVLCYLFVFQLSLKFILLIVKHLVVEKIHLFGFLFFLSTELHFADVVQGEEFLNLGIEQVCSLIASDKLTVPSEEKVFEAVIAWVNHDKDVRQEHMAHLMEHVRLPLLSREYLVQRVEEESLVKNSSACKDYLIEAMKYHLLPAEQRAMMKTIRTRMRTPVSLPKVMVVVGGQAPKAIRSVECYDFKEEKWKPLDCTEASCLSHFVLEFYVYSFFKIEHQWTLKGLCEVYFIAVKNLSCPWKPLHALPLNTLYIYKYLGCCNYFVLGILNHPLSFTVFKDIPGLNGPEYDESIFFSVSDGLAFLYYFFISGLSSVEAYNTKTNEWFHVVPMNTRRSSVGVGVVGGLLYAVGGYDGASRQCLSTVEAYHPNTNEWNYVAEMSTRRSGAGVGVLKGLLYAVGGHDGPLVRKSCEVYDPATNSWKQVADMNMCRRNAGVCAINSLLYVVGGDDGSCNLSSVEHYNPVTDKWTLLPSCMSTGRSYAGKLGNICSPKASVLIRDLNI